MMSLNTYFKVMLFATITALTYTHMQMRIVELGYKSKAKQRTMHDLQDRQGLLTHELLVLKSSKHLGERLLNKDDALQFIGRDKVMTVNAPALAVPVSPVQKPRVNVDNPLWHWLSFLSIPEARAFDH